MSPWEDADLPMIVELADEEGVRWSRSLAGVRSIDDARRWLSERRRPDRVDWAVRDPRTRVLIGRTSLHRFTDRPPSGEVAYGVHPAHRRRGVAAAAVGTAVPWAFAWLGLRRVELVHDVGNTASCRVATRCGFALEGVERSALGYPDGRVGDQLRHARLAGDRRRGGARRRDRRRVGRTAADQPRRRVRRRGARMHRVQLAHAVDNVASCRVAEKAGFRLEGTLRGSNRLASGFADEHVHARVAGDPDAGSAVDR